MEMARAMIHEKIIDYKLWGEGVKTSSYILNYLPTSKLNKAPHELWIGSKPDISHFCVFGCKAFVHVLDEICLKLEPKSIPCIFIGYLENSKACILQS